MKSRVAVFGGSFNPPHMGHAMVASWIHWSNKADEVWFMPTFSHAFAKELAPFELRVRMCEALTSILGDWARVTEIEERLPRPSYTIDSLSALQELHPSCVFKLVVGADVLQDIHAWKQWDQIEAKFAPVVVGRSGYPNPENTVVFPAISSTEVRRRVREGLPVDHLIPAGVQRLYEPSISET